MKKAMSIFLATLLLVLAVSYNVSADSLAAEKNVIIATDGEIINTQTYNIDGAVVVFTMYNKDGAISDTVEILSFGTANRSGGVSDALAAEIESISAQRASIAYAAMGNVSSSSSSRAVKSNSAAGTGAGENPNTYAGHYTVYTVNGVEVTYSDGYSRVLYGGEKILSWMKVTETISNPSIGGYTVDFPSNFYGGTSSATLSSTWQGNYYMCTQYRNNFTAYGTEYVPYVRVETTAQVGYDNESSSAYVSSNW